ncbi:MAG: MBL fold metallo-hydrolase [Myxococcales bacterium]
MGHSLRQGASLGFEGQPGSFLYDCHAERFVEAEHGASATSGFVPLYLAQLFGVAVGEWNALTREAAEVLARSDARGAERWLKQHAPRGDLRMAAEAALLVYPTMERFVERCDGAHAPFRLSPDWLMQPNVPLTRLQLRDAEGNRVPVLDAMESSDSREHARELLVELGAGRLEPKTPRAGALGPYLEPVDVPPREPAPGVYLCGHSSVLVRGRRGGLLLDPIGFSRCGSIPGALAHSVLQAHVTAVALTHLHFDHYNLPTLLSLSNRPIVVPRVPGPTIVAEDAHARLLDFGVPDVRAPRWGERLVIDDLIVRVLPFRGEQLLTSEEHREARNWGNTYVVEWEGARVLVVADAGFEPGRSMLDEVEAFRAAHGPVDLVITQAAGMRMCFGGGDPDFQVTGLTCAHRAPEALALLAPERRMTFAPEDVPALCEASGARAVVLHGQFRSARDEPAVESAASARTRAALKRHPVARLHEVATGHGLGLPGLQPVRL